MRLLLLTNWEFGGPYFFIAPEPSCSSVTITNIPLFSLIAHKEFRFLLPVVSILLCYAGQGFNYICKHVSPRLLFQLVLLLNVPMALYFGLVHQRGAIDAIDYIRESSIENKDVLFLMPCHSTPYYR